MNHFRVEFGPIDALNPRCGYSLKIENASSGNVVLWTSKAPDTGEPLTSPADCLRVIAMYV